MSEISVLSNLYETVVNTTDSLNNSIISLKKRYIKRSELRAKYKSIKLTEAEYKKAKEFILDFLEFIIKLQKEQGTELDFIPQTLIKDFGQKIDSIPFIEKIIPTIIEILKQEGDLTEEQFLLLDKIASTLDSERTVLFRKLKMARG